MPLSTGDGVTTKTKSQKAPSLISSTSTCIRSPSVGDKEEQQIQQKQDQQQTRSAFFRGGSAGNERKSLDPCVKLSPTLANPTKGDFIDCDPPQIASSDGSVFFTSSNIKPTSVTTSTEPLVRDLHTPSNSASSSSRSRNPQRFSARKRAVRVRSESRPISALYDIICKEKGLDIGSTSSDSSPVNINDEDYNNEKQKKRNIRTKSANSNALDYIETNNNNNNNINTMSGSLDSPGIVFNRTQKSISHEANPRSPIAYKMNENYSYLNVMKDLTQSESLDELGCQLKSCPKQTNLLEQKSTTKASSLPPSLVNNRHQIHTPESKDFGSNHESQIHTNNNFDVDHKMQQKEHVVQTNLPYNHHHYHYKDNEAHQENNHNHNPLKASCSLCNIPDDTYFEKPPVKLNVEQPINMPDLCDTFKNSKISSGLDGKSNDEQCYHASHQRRLREGNRRHTDGAIILSPTASSYDDGVDAQKEHVTSARRFINRMHRSRSALNSVPAQPNSEESSSPTTSPSKTRRSPSPSPPLLSLQVKADSRLDASDPLKPIPASIDEGPGSAMTNSNAKSTNVVSSNNITNTTEGESITTELSHVPAVSSSIVSDKKKDEEQALQQKRYTSPSSLHHSPMSPQLKTSNSKYCSSSSDNPAGASDSDKSCTPIASPIRRSAGVTPKKLVPSVSVSMKQNLSDVHYHKSGGAGGASSKLATSPKQKHRSQTTECTVRVQTPAKAKSHLKDTAISINEKLNDCIEDSGAVSNRPRCSTMHSDEKNKHATSENPEGTCSKDISIDLSPVPVRKSKFVSSPEVRDKSSKRKSNLNRSLNDESTQNRGDPAIRRRRRRELGFSRPILPPNDLAVQNVKKTTPSETFLINERTNKVHVRHDLAYHMENARRGLDLINAHSIDRRRAHTTSPKLEEVPPKSVYKERINRRSDTQPFGGIIDQRKQRSKDVNRKVNERTKSDLAEIIKIAERATASETTASESKETSLASERHTDSSTNEAINDLTSSINRIRASHERELIEPNEEKDEAKPSISTVVKHATFVVDNSNNDDFTGTNSAQSMLRQRVLKARSVERDTYNEKPNLSPILRRKSSDEPAMGNTGSMHTSPAHNHIVSILKKKYHLAGDSSSASSNTSPVTFSANVVDTPAKQKRTGILKKRSSLDESRYYSRSHSPDERSILIKSARRNSLEGSPSGSHQISHGILKQSSYDSSKSDGCPSATEPHGILKKKDSTSTPSDGGSNAPKHVSISQAVILAAAELGHSTSDGGFVDYEEMYTPSNEEYEIRPILKVESTSSEDLMRPPKPILKKKASGESDEYEIRPILKTSRKSSREECDLNGSASDVRPILKTESPYKRRSLGGYIENDSIEESLSSSMLKRRTRSLERQQEPPVVNLAAALMAIATSQSTPTETVHTASVMSVADRIKNMERFLSTQTSPSNSTEINANTSWESPLQSNNAIRILKPSAIRREFYRDRYKTQPVTSDEKNYFKAATNLSAFDTSATSAFKPTNSLESLNYVTFAASNKEQQNQQEPENLVRTFTHNFFKSNLPPAAATSIGKQHCERNPGCSGDGDNLADERQSDIKNKSGFKISDQSTLSLGSDSERIFEMSGIEQQQQANASQQDVSSDEIATGGSTSIGRTSSVRARANMFQQMQEKKQAFNQEERLTPNGSTVLRRTSPAPLNSSSNNESKTHNNATDPDGEIEPSSLSLSERLRFFSSLSLSGNQNSYTRSPSYNSGTSNYSFFMANTPRSSTSASSASITPTPMECSPIVPEGNSLETDSHTDSSDSASHDIIETSAFIKLATAQSQLSGSIQSDTPQTPTAEFAPPEITMESMTPTCRRIKLRLIGKLMLPNTFLQNNINGTNVCERNGIIESNEENSSSDSAGTKSPSKLPVKKIGKIKSPFIENCQLMSSQQSDLKPKCRKYDATSTPYNSNSSSSSISALTSRENNENSENGASRKILTGGTTPRQSGNINAVTENISAGKENCAEAKNEYVSPVVEMRKKFTRIISHSSGSSIGQTVTAAKLTSNTSLKKYSNGPSQPIARSPMINEKFAKYFGISSGDVNKNSNGNSDSAMAAAINKNVRLPILDNTTESELSSPYNISPKSSTLSCRRRDVLKRSRAVTSLINSNDVATNMKPLSARLWRMRSRTVTNGADLTQQISEVKQFEDIVVTKEEFIIASKEFDRLFVADV